MESDNNEEEKKLNDDDIRIEKVLHDLDDEFIIFQEEYNQSKLQNIIDQIIDTDSTINEQFKAYKENVDKIVVASKSFNEYIQDIEGVMTKLCKPDPAEYANWNIEQIMVWIQSLENGRYHKYLDALKNGLEKDGISGDVLPELTRQDLAISPYNITNFKDRKQIAIHFQSLSTESPGKDQGDISEKEGTATADL